MPDALIAAVEMATVVIIGVAHDGVDAQEMVENQDDACRMMVPIAVRRRTRRRPVSGVVNARR
jgi:hypothetical protein